MDITPKTSVILIGALVLSAVGSYFGYVALLDRSAKRFITPRISAMVMQRSADDYMTLSTTPLGSNPGITQRQVVNSQFERLALLGNVKSFEPLTVDIDTGYQFPPQFHPSAQFHQQVTFDNGSVLIEGTMKRDGHWTINSIGVQPQGAAQQIVHNQMLANEDYHSALEGLPTDNDVLFSNYIAHNMYIERQAGLSPQSLDGQFKYAMDHDERMPDGRTVVYTLGRAIRETFGQEPWDTSYATLQRWRAQAPASPSAAITEAIYWREYAWAARGDGYASTVTAEGNELFHERMLRAKQTLDDSKTYASVNPLWYSAYLHVAVALGDSDLFQRIFSEAQERYPTYDGVYYVAVWAMQPKWYGSYDIEEKLIANAADKTHSKEGEGLYARLYWFLDDDQEPEFDLFHDTQASWPRMKQGFEDLRHMHPDSKEVLRNYAAFACAAGDKPTFLMLTAQLGGDANPAAWRRAHVYASCKQKLL